MISEKKRVVLTGTVHVSLNIVELTYDNHSKYAFLFLQEFAASK